MIFAAAMVVVIAVVVAVLLLGGGEDADSTSASGAAADCESVDAPEAKTVDLPGPDAKAPTSSKVVFDTSCGSFTVTLDADRAPKTAASFEYLAEEGVFDNTQFHRVVPGFVVQGGDPEGTGLGGPGFTVTERPPRDVTYDRGLVAMAKSDAEPPGTSGSQFFVVTAPADAGLPPDFALVGEVTEGFETVQAIEALGDESGASVDPSMPVVINTATVEG
ncbi:MAG: peptidylprolyl isomerase [Solirubrobacterales bacterium]